jgi:Gpi18-like mannosyltransferase
MLEKSTKQKFLNKSYVRLTSLIKKVPREIYFIIILFLITRTVLTFSGLLSRQILKDVYKNWYEWRYDKHQWLDIWSVWDSGWYLDIAENGYSPTLQSTLPKKTCCGQSNIVFFPLYPIGIRFFGNIIGSYYLSGVLISNASFLLASIFFYKLVSDMFDKQIAKRAVLFLYLFPTSYFFSALLTEGFFFLTVVLSFYFAYRKKWFTSSLFAFLSALTRSVGVLVIVPLLIGYLHKKIKDGKKIDYKILFFGLVLLAPVGVALFMHHLTGNPLSTFLVEKMAGGTALQTQFLT